MNKVRFRVLYDEREEVFLGRGSYMAATAFRDRFDGEACVLVDDLTGGVWVQRPLDQCEPPSVRDSRRGRAAGPGEEGRR